MNQVIVLKKIAETGLRIFSTDVLRGITQELGLKDTYLPQLIHRYSFEGVVRKLHKGVYALPQDLMAGPPLSEFEIACHLATPSALCCWSAFVIHGLTDQVLNHIYVMAPYGRKHFSSKTSFEIERTTYKIINVSPQSFFGTEIRWITEAPITVTDLERTLLEGLIRPEYCGGFREVMEAYGQAKERLNQNKLIDYGKKISLSVLKRIGWVLEEIGIHNEGIEDLQRLPCTSCYKVDVSSPSSGKWNARWNMKENI